MIVEHCKRGILKKNVFRRKRTERSDSNESVSSTLQVPVPSISETVLRRVTQERVDELKKLIRNERTKYKKILQTLEQVFNALFFIKFR